MDSAIERNIVFFIRLMIIMFVFFKNWMFSVSVSFGLAKATFCFFFVFNLFNR